MLQSSCKFILFLPQVEIFYTFYTFYDIQRWLFILQISLPTDYPTGDPVTMCCQVIFERTKFVRSIIPQFPSDCLSLVSRLVISHERQDVLMGLGLVSHHHRPLWSLRLLLAPVCAFHESNVFLTCVSPLCHSPRSMKVCKLSCVWFILVATPIGSGFCMVSIRRCV